MEEETAEPIEDFVMDWNVSELEARMRKITGIRSGNIMYSDVKSITQLDLSDCVEPIDIGAMSYLTNLKELNLFRSKIGNISALSILTNLKHLDLSGNHISDISVLSSFKSLSYLNLEDNPITDYSPTEQLNIENIYN